MTDLSNEHRKTHWHRLLAQAVEEPLTTVNSAVRTEVDVTSGSPKADIILLLGIRKIRMEGTMENMEPIGLTPGHVLDLGRREWLASMMRSMPREELLKMPEVADIRQEGEQKGGAKILVRLLIIGRGERAPIAAGCCAAPAKGDHLPLTPFNWQILSSRLTPQ
jgi:hypothetical protein